MISVVDEVCGLATEAIENVLGSIEFDLFINRVVHQVHRDKDSRGGCGLEHLGDVTGELVLDDLVDVGLEPRLANPVGDSGFGDIELGGDGFGTSSRGNHVSCQAVDSFFLLDLSGRRLGSMECGGKTFPRGENGNVLWWDGLHREMAPARRGVEALNIEDHGSVKRMRERTWEMFLLPSQTMPPVREPLELELPSMVVKLPWRSGVD